MNWFAMKLAGSLICVAVVSADKSYIMVDAARESWISMGNLTTLLQVSFNISKCCNVYISGESAGTEYLFNEFSRIYPYEYVVNSKTYNCDGYFMISESVDNLVAGIKNTPTVISTTELLVIVDDNVEESAGIFNVLLYENANVNIVALNGLWSLSENFLRPRVFKKMSRHIEMVHKRGVVDFEGRELQAAGLTQAPLCYLHTIENKTVNGVRGEFFVAKDKSEMDGVELKLFLLIAERLNFTWSLRRPHPSERYGMPNGTHWNGGVIGLISEKKVDIAFGAIWLTWETYRFVNVTTPWAILDIHFLVPRPKPRTSFWALTRPLSPEVWVSILAMIIAQSIYVYTSAWISPRITKRFQSFTVTWTELMGRLVGTWAPREMKGLKLQFLLWHFIGLLVVTAYSSSLAASLTNLRYEDRVDTPRDFVRANLSWGRKYRVMFDYLFENHDHYRKSFMERFALEKSEEDRHQRILKGNYAIVGSTLGSIFFPEDDVRPDDLRRYRLMKTSMSKYYTVFAVQPWLLESADQVMLWMNEGGLVRYHVDDIIHRRAGSALREVMIEHDGYVKGARVLKLTPLAAGFSMFLVGLAIATVTFCVELYTASRKKSIHHVLTDIKKNRDVRRGTESTRRSSHRISETPNGKEYDVAQDEALLVLKNKAYESTEQQKNVLIQEFIYLD